MISVRPPSRPASPVRRKQPQLSETEIDIYTSRKDTEIDIHRHASKSRGRSQERRSPRHAYDDDLLIHADTGRLHVDVERRRSVSRSGRRAHSEAPPHIDFDDEARYITSKIDSRGQMGEAYNGITKDWTIIDVPPGTERVRLDGAGGASAEVTWQKYSGVRRSQFIPERDERSVVSSGSDRDHDRDRERDRDARDSRLSIQIYNERGGDDRERVTEKVTDRRISIHGSQNPRRSEMWTEITKDLVTREAIEELGYDYEETEYFFYIMQYLRYVSCPPVELLFCGPVTNPSNRRMFFAAFSFPTRFARLARIAFARFSGSASTLAMTTISVITTTTTTATAAIAHAMIAGTTSASVSSSTRSSMTAEPVAGIAKCSPLMRITTRL